jgi:hypothetical protein
MNGIIGKHHPAPIQFAQGAYKFPSPRLQDFHHPSFWISPFPDTGDLHTHPVPVHGASHMRWGNKHIGPSFHQEKRKTGGVTMKDTFHKLSGSFKAILGTPPFFQNSFTKETLKDLLDLFSVSLFQPEPPENAGHRMRPIRFFLKKVQDTLFQQGSFEVCFFSLFPGDDVASFG